MDSINSSGSTVKQVRGHDSTFFCIGHDTDGNPVVSMPGRDATVSEIAELILFLKDAINYAPDEIEPPIPIIERIEAQLSAPKKTRPGYVYLIHCEGYYKIGRASKLIQRVETLLTGNPFDSSLTHQIYSSDRVALESYWHKRFKSKRHRREWFDLSAEDVAEFCAQDAMEVAA